MNKLSLDKLSLNQINYLNIFFMALSAFFAILIPFELFLFVYAFIGPLHYLTEIAWLEKKNYFTQNKIEIYIFIPITVFLTYFMFNPSEMGNQMGAFLIYWAFVFAFCFAFFKNIIWRLSIGLGIGLLSYLLGFYTNYQFMVFAGALLPTMVHVLIFTGIFILLGAVKSKSTSAYLSALFFILMVLSLVFIPWGKPSFTTSRYILESYNLYTSLNKVIGDTFAFGKIRTVNDVFYSATGLAIMRIIAFAYCYHYLNWFSKTSIIKWHEVSKAKLSIVLVLWLSSIALYTYDYYIGFMALYFLSLLHVLLEFPLNHISIKELFQSLIRSK